MGETARCQSCSMTIESGELCRHCSDGQGNLIAFEECVERFIQWVRRNEPGIGDDEARRRTIAYMATMPAWKDHPGVTGGGGA